MPVARAAARFLLHRALRAQPQQQLALAQAGPAWKGSSNDGSRPDGTTLPSGAPTDVGSILSTSTSFRSRGNDGWRDHSTKSDSILPCTFRLPRPSSFLHLRHAHAHSQRQQEEDDRPPPVSPTALSGGHAVHDERFQRELHSLNVAIIANGLIFVAKIWVHLVSGSSSILAEALHSIADVLNQLLLRIGVLKSMQGPTVQYNYGYLRDRFVWSLISAVGIFFLGAGASVIHGIHSLTNTHQVEGVFWTFVVLGVSGLLEGYSLHVAVKSLRVGAAERNMSLLAYIKSGMDPTTVAVFMEDGGAIVGLIIAAIGTALTHYTGSAVWDAVGSIGVGLLLGAIATFLVRKNRQLLIGRSMNPQEVEEIMAMLKRDPVVSYVTDTKTEEIGPRIFRFKAEVAWDGERLAGRYLSRVGREQLVRRLRIAMDDPDPAALDQVLKGYGRGIISAVGSEVDRIELEIQSLNPGIHYVDLETDRGRSRPGPANSADMDFDHQVQDERK